MHSVKPLLNLKTLQGMISQYAYRSTSIGALLALSMGDHNNPDHNVPDVLRDTI